MTTYLFPFLLQKQIILLDFHLTEVSNNSRCKEYICKYLRNPHFCSISKIKRWGGEYCIKTYLATPRPLLCHLSGNATPSVMSLIWQRHALCYVTYLATPRPLLCHLSGNATPSVMSLIRQRHALCYVTYLATPRPLLCHTGQVVVNLM
jgi:hypothetical protein